MSVSRWGAGFHGYSGAEQGVTGHYTGRTGTDQGPTGCGGREVRTWTPDFIHKWFTL